MAVSGYIPRGFRQIPHAPSARIPRYPGEGRLSGGGSNPLRGGAPEPADTQGQGDFIAPPNHVGGLIGLFLDPQRDKEYEQKVNARDTARQEKVQAGVDAYQQALEKTGDPKQALASVFHSDSEGHVHFADPPTFNAILALHQVASQGQPQEGGQFQSVDLGHGLVGVADPSGKYSVHNAHDAQTAGGKGFNLAPGHTHYDTEGNPVVTAPMGEKPQKELPTTKAQTDQLQDVQTVLDQVQKMRNSVGASGSLGYGSIERGLAMHTGFGGKQAEAYNEAYNEMAPALVRLARVPGQSKLVAQLALDRLPKPGNAQAFNVDQVLPGIEYGMRQQVANLYQTYKLENRVGGREMAKSIAQTYDAHPDQMKELEQAKLDLRLNPGQMPKERMDALWTEAQNGRLPYDDWTRVMRQAIQRKLILPTDFDKAAAASPDLAQISPEEHTDPSLIPQGPPPGVPPVQQIPSGAPPGPAGSQMAPQGQNPSPQTSPQPTSFPAGGQAPLAPTMGGQPQSPTFQPPPQGQPPTPPTSDQQTAQAPEQIQQQAEDQAPGQNNGFLSQLMQHLPTALQNLFGGQQPPTTGQ